MINFVRAMYLFWMIIAGYMYGLVAISHYLILLAFALVFFAVAGVYAYSLIEEEWRIEDEKAEAKRWAAYPLSKHNGKRLE